jgi:hypothetical protein
VRPETKEDLEETLLLTASSEASVESFLELLPVERLELLGVRGLVP